MPNRAAIASSGKPASVRGHDQELFSVERSKNRRGRFSCGCGLTWLSVVIGSTILDLNKGPHILEAITALDSILHRMKRHQNKKQSLLRRLHSWTEPGSESEMAAHWPVGWPAPWVRLRDE